jgi:hypothetical protein
MVWKTLGHAGGVREISRGSSELRERTPPEPTFILAGTPEAVREGIATVPAPPPGCILLRMDIRGCYPRLPQPSGLKAIDSTENALDPDAIYGTEGSLRQRERR